MSSRQERPNGPQGRPSSRQQRGKRGTASAAPLSGENRFYILVCFLGIVVRLLEQSPPYSTWRCMILGSCPAPKNLSIGGPPDAAVDYPRTHEAFAALHSEGHEVGSSFAAHVDGKLAVSVAAGTLTREGWGGKWLSTPPSPVTLDTPFALLSLGGLYEALALGILVDEGLVEWADPIDKHWPGFAVGGKSDVTVQNIMEQRFEVKEGERGWGSGSSEVDDSDGPTGAAALLMERLQSARLLYGGRTDYLASTVIPLPPRSFADGLVLGEFVRRVSSSSSSTTTSSSSSSSSIDEQDGGGRGVSLQLQEGQQLGGEGGGGGGGGSLCSLVQSSARKASTAAGASAAAESPILASAATLAAMTRALEGCRVWDVAILSSGPAWKERKEEKKKKKKKKKKNKKEEEEVEEEEEEEEEEKEEEDRSGWSCCSNIPLLYDLPVWTWLLRYSPQLLLSSSNRFVKLFVCRADFLTDSKTAEVEERCEGGLSILSSLLSSLFFSPSPSYCSSSSPKGLFSSISSALYSIMGVNVDKVDIDSSSVALAIAAAGALPDNRKARRLNSALQSAGAAWGVKEAPGQLGLASAEDLSALMHGLASATLVTEATRDVLLGRGSSSDPTGGGLGASANGEGSFGFARLGREGLLSMDPRPLNSTAVAALREQEKKEEEEKGEGKEEGEEGREWRAREAAVKRVEDEEWAPSSPAYDPDEWEQEEEGYLASKEQQRQQHWKGQQEQGDSQGGGGVAGGPTRTTPKSTKDNKKKKKKMKGAPVWRQRGVFFDSCVGLVDGGGGGVAWCRWEGREVSLAYLTSQLAVADTRRWERMVEALARDLGIDVDAH